MKKPFHFDELLSSIKAVMRRFQQAQNNGHVSTDIIIQDLRIDMNIFKIFLNNEPVDHSPKEFKLLTYLVDNANKTVSRFQILNAVWGITFENHTNVLDVYISYLKGEIEKNGTKFIHTIKGIGYLFKT